MKERIGSEAKRLHDRMLEAGKRFFSLDEAVSIGGKTHNATGLLLGRLCDKGWAMRICEGRYGLAGDGEGMLRDPLVVGRELAGGACRGGSETLPYYISHGSAMAVWGMKTYPPAPFPLREGETHPQPLPEGRGETEVIVSLKGRRLARREVMGVRYRFVNDAEIEPWKLAGLGRPHPGQWLTVEVEVAPKEFVVVSDPEWTIVSGLGRPDLCGGVEGLLRALELWRGRLDLERLMRYANLARNRTAPRRLGYLLDLAGMQTEVSRLSLGLAVCRNYRRLEPGVRGDLEGSWRLEVREGFGEGDF